MPQIQPTIKSPCHLKWQELEATENNQKRFCPSCSSCVHDITEMNTSQINALHNKYNGDLCIKASSKQLKNTNHSSIPLYRKIGAAFVISLLSLTGFKATAQEEQHNGDLDYILTAKDSKDSQITIKGRIKLKGVNGDKVSSENIILKIFTRTQSSVRKVKEIHLSKKGVFKIELEKILLNEGFFISISEEEYLNKPIILDHLPVKDIKIKGTLDKERIFFMVGRFF